MSLPSRISHVFLALIAFLTLPSYSSSINNSTPDLTQIDRKIKVPKWELNISSLYFSLPHYPGSNHLRTLSLPIVPFGIYRFKNISADKNALFVRTSANTLLKLDFGLRIPVDGDSKFAQKPSNNTVVSTKNYHRRGMSQRNLIFKMGVQITHSLTSNININLPFLLNFNAQKLRNIEGYEINPAIEFNLFPTLDTRETRLRMRLRWSYADKKLSNYFYKVKSSEVLSDRPAYNAKAGEIERTFDIAYFHRYSSYFSYFFAWRYSDYSHSANRESPLHVTDIQQSVGVGITYTFARSRVNVTRFPSL